MALLYHSGFNDAVTVWTLSKSTGAILMLLVHVFFKNELLMYTISWPKKRCLGLLVRFSFLSLFCRISSWIVVKKCIVSLNVLCRLSIPMTWPPAGVRTDWEWLLLSGSHSFVITLRHGWIPHSYWPTSMNSHQLHFSSHSQYFLYEINPFPNNWDSWTRMGLYKSSPEMRLALSLQPGAQKDWPSFFLLHGKTLH